MINRFVTDYLLPHVFSQSIL